MGFFFLQDFLFFHIYKYGLCIYIWQEKHLKLWIFECKEPSHDAFILGIAAASLLGIAHVLANLLGGCSICTTDDIQKASPSRRLSMACLIFTW